MENTIEKNLGLVIGQNTKQAEKNLALLDALADNQFHSGQALANQFGISRASISNWINKLRQAGVAIHSVSGKGYCFPEYVRPYDVNQLKSELDGAAEGELINAKFLFDYQVESTSTNETVKTLFKTTLHRPILATTEKQTQGRGRRGRVWHSPYAQNCYLSLGYRFNAALSELSGLSLVVGLAFAEALSELNFPVELKWPNDLYLNGKKLGGILVELEGTFDAPCDVIIGVGLNVNMPLNDDGTEQIDQAWTSLSQYKGEVVDRTHLLLIIIPKLESFLAIFEQQGFTKFAQLWPQYDRYIDQAVNIISAEKVITGIAQGINEQGELLLQTEQGLLNISGGEISLRPVE
ncbi:bifunctional biotin--[acetyl-CoA-carboxylase] ligase/biotin operon repressor BirA [Catenovulum maritimum]|uniref:bifunctional biotin--[acetyl-CoA-carboxylase] ligase/biotin operon repressor BirA n=1 Tax=Catenovulum maritimum TaxID=1513271 RepID=UPI0006610A71|nr:bifunctional biotin--[acetyl-CoA-carboxylase] ligase/biotin operon repressor BirA [Catenovulum maritimum]